MLYSGDLRLHGRKPGMAKQLIEAASKSPIDVMLMEGTLLGAEELPVQTELGVEQEIYFMLRSTGGWLWRVSRRSTSIG